MCCTYLDILCSRLQQRYLLWRALSPTMQDDTSKQRRQEREKNLALAREFRRQADDASGAERDTLLQKAQTFFQKV